jgi:endoglucanase
MMQILDDWHSGYCAQLSVRNGGTRPVAWRVEPALGGRVIRVWNALQRPGTGAAQFNGLDWNRTLAPGASTCFGICVQRDADALVVSGGQPTPLVHAAASPAP